MAFVRSFVCIISVIATDKVRYSMVPGRTEREDGGGRRCGGNTESRWTINDKRRGKVFCARAEHPLIRACLYLHTSRVRFSQITDECFYRPMRYSNERRARVRDVKSPHTSHNENKRVRRWSTRLIKNRSYRSVRERESRRKEEEGASRAADLIIR